MATVSILLPTRNRPNFFEAALRSALAQRFNDIEIVVCDNSNNDDTRTIIEKYLHGAGERIKYFKNTRDIGMLDNWQMCYSLATGEYINYLMDDDLFHPEKIAKMMDYFDRHVDVSLVTSYRQLIDEHGAAMTDRDFNVSIVPVDTVIDGISLGDMMLTDLCNYIGEPTTVLFRRRDLSERFGVYRGEQSINNADVVTWLNLLRRGRAVYISNTLSYFRIHGGQLSNNLANRVNGVADWIRVALGCVNDGFLGRGGDYSRCMRRLQVMIADVFRQVLNAGILLSMNTENLKHLTQALRNSNRRRVHLRFPMPLL